MFNTVSYNLDFFLILGFLFHFSLLYLKSFRILSFIMNLEFVYLLLVLVFCHMFMGYECTFLLVYMTMFACEAATKLAMLVGFLRLSDKKIVKSSSFVGI